MSRRSSWDRSVLGKRFVSRKGRESPAVDDTFTASDYLVGNSIDNIEGMLKLVRENTDNTIINHSTALLSPDHDRDVEETPLSEHTLSDLLKQRCAPEINRRVVVAQRGTKNAPIKSLSHPDVYPFKTNTRSTSLSKKVRDEQTNKLSHRDWQQHHSPKPIINLTGPIRVETSRMITRRNDGYIAIEDRVELLSGSERNRNVKLQNIIPTVIARNSNEAQQLQPSCTHSVSVSDNYIVIERTTLLKQLLSTPSKTKRFQESRAFHCPQRPQGKQRPGLVIQSESALEKRAIFNLCGPLEVISKQETVAGSNREYMLRESIELRADGSTEQPQQELIPFKGEVRKPPINDAIVSECKYDESVHIGQNVIVVKRDITITPSQTAPGKPLSFTELRSYSTDRTVSTSTTISERSRSPLPRLSNCITAKSPDTSTPKSPNNVTAESPSDLTAKSPTYATAKSQRSYGCFSPTLLSSYGLKEVPSLEDALPKEEQPSMKLFDAIPTTEKGITAMEAVRDSALPSRTNELNSSSFKTKHKGLKSSSLGTKPIRPKAAPPKSPLNVAATTPPSVVMHSALDNLTDPCVTVTPKTPPLELSPRLQLNTPGHSRSPLKNNHRGRSPAPSQDARTIPSSGTKMTIKDKQQLKPMLLKHLSHIQKQKDKNAGGAGRLTQPMSQELLISPGSKFVEGNCSSEDAGKNIEELLESTKKEHKMRSKKGKGVNLEQKPFDNNDSHRKDAHHIRSTSQQPSTKPVLRGNQSNYNRATSHSAEVLKTALSSSKETLRTISAESAIPLGKRFIKEAVLASQQLWNKFSESLKSSAQRTNDKDSSKTASHLHGNSSKMVAKSSGTSNKELIDTATLFSSSLNRTPEAINRSETSLKTAREGERKPAQFSIWSKVKPLPQVLREDIAQKIQQTRQFYDGPTSGGKQQKTTLKEKDESELLRTAQETISEGYSNNSFSLGPRNGVVLRNELKATKERRSERLREDMKRSSRLAGHQMKHEDDFLRTAQEKSNLDLRRQQQFREQKTNSDEELLKMAREKRDFRSERQAKLMGQQAYLEDEQIETARENAEISLKGSMGIESGALRIQNSDRISNRQYLGEMKAGRRVWQANAPVSGLRESSFSEKRKRGKHGCREIKKHTFGSTKASQRGRSMKAAKLVSSKGKGKFDASEAFRHMKEGTTMGNLGDEKLTAVCATSDSIQRLSKEANHFNSESQRNSKRSSEISTAREDSLMSRTRCHSPRTSTMLRAATSSATSKENLKDHDEIVIEATDVHCITISLKICIKMKTSGSQSANHTHRLRTSRIFVGGREVYSKNRLS